MRILLLFIFIFFIVDAGVYGQERDRDIVLQISNLLLDSRFQEAIDLADSEASGETMSVIVTNKKAEALTRLGRLNEAQELLERNQTILKRNPNEFLQAVTETNIGFLRLNQGRSDLAEESLRTAIREFEQSGKPRSEESAMAFANLGLVYMSLGKYAQAEEQLQRALSIREAVLGEAHELIAATYNDLGLVYSQTDKDKALDYFEKAQDLYRQLHGNDHPKLAIASINIGIIYRELEFYGDAVNNFETSLKIWNTVYPQPHPAKAITLYNLGQTYLRMKDQKAAMGYYERAYKMYEETYGAKHPEVASILNAIGNLYLAQSQFNEALATYQKALQANVPDFNDSDLSANPRIKNYYHGTRLLHSLLFKAEAFESRYLGKSLKFSDLKESLAVLDKCDSLIDHLRQQSSNQADKLLFGGIASEVYADGVRIAYEAGLNAVNKNHYFRKAFYFAEKSKSAVLLESISDSNAKSFARIPASLLEDEKNLKSSISLVAQKLAGKPSPDEERILRERSFNLNRDYEAFTQKLEHQFPEYFNLKFNSVSPSIEELQTMLPSQTAIVSYFIDDKDNHLYIFLIQRNRFTVVSRRLPADFDKHITGLRNGLYFNEINAFRRSAYELGRVLIPRIPGAVRELVILPTGRLGVVPFETLLTGNADKAVNYQSLPYLLNRVSLRYEFSAGLILQKSKAAKTQASPSIFLCAPVTFPGNNALAELPGTEAEVSEIAKLFTENHLKTESVTRARAGEMMVKSDRLKNYNLLHFATHGVVDEANPELSRIYLQSDAEAEDGNLFAGEIYNLELNANLVTLSACQTGLGKIFKGEGVIGLSRALVYAGAKNIIVSFWSVADESTSMFMKDFYHNLLSHPGQNYSADLRQAKLNLLHSEKYADPFYWAPFVLIGF
jgi:CHAT domain-containing protein/Tfp pilus assembly protein PilF